MRWIRWSLLAVLAGALMGAPIWAPRLLREARWFEVEQVEISGTRFLPAHDLLAASGITAGQNVWDEAEHWETALRAHPGIQDARVTRRLPGTLRVRVVEKQPVAYVLDGTLLPVTATGDRFPIDPARAPVDLPIVRGAWPDTVEGGPTRALLQEVGRLAELDPALLAETSEVRRVTGTDALLLTHRLGEIVLPAGASAGRLEELRAVLREIEGRSLEEPDAPRLARVDARYAAQIVVRILSSV